MANGHERYSVGIRNVGSYQVSGMPWITGSVSLSASWEDKVEFPSITKAFTVINRTIGANSQIRVHFNPTGAIPDVINNYHYVELDNDESSIKFNCKEKHVYISSPASGNVKSYTVIAELTNIPTSSNYVLTGSGISE